MIRRCALGLLAPLLSLTPAAAFAAESSFADLQPSDWAYQALNNLIERYGCVSGYGNGTVRGNAAISRYEAAALLNTCLERISEVTDESKRLLQEFERELAVVRGRVDGLEAKVGSLEALAFSTTTKLSGLGVFVLGGNRFLGNAQSPTTACPSLEQPSIQFGVQQAKSCFGAATLNYELELTLDTSFTGKDLLRVNLRNGNFVFASNSFGGPFLAPTNLSQLEIAFQSDGGPTEVDIDRLFYQVPLGDFTFTLGGRVGQDDMLALWPSVYPSQSVLDITTTNGASTAYNKNLGAGAGIWWQKNGYSISANYVAAYGGIGDPSLGGIATTGAGGTGTVQVGYSTSNWGIAGIYSQMQNENGWVGYTTNFMFNSLIFNPGTTSAFGLGGYWAPTQASWLPSISAGLGANKTTYDPGVETTGLVKDSFSWNVGLQWSDVFEKGNTAGLAVGQATYATNLYGGETPQDANYVWEGWYSFQVSDNLAVTPALFYLSRPQGGVTPSNQSFNQLGALIKTTFRF
ncbi:iron uptake porin [Vulcanococcus sp.]|uniref:iron uptake porin n=1 Tax=Vulcanococcus sp. TaxID=2856995 RepID=UPI003C08BFF7